MSDTAEMIRRTFSAAHGIDLEEHLVILYARTLDLYRREWTDAAIELDFDDEPSHFTRSQGRASARRKSE